VQGSVPVGISGVKLGALGEKKQHNGEVSESAREVQGRVPDPARHVKTARGHGGAAQKRAICVMTMNCLSWYVHPMDKRGQ